MSSMHILLIEPDCILSRICCRAFEAAGHSVVATCSAQKAVHLADQRCPDVVVLEVQLPRHNGIEFLYEFRSYSEWLHVPVLIHSVVPPQELEQAATLRRELGVTAVLHKPATELRQLVAAVQRSQPIAAI